MRDFQAVIGAEDIPDAVLKARVEEALADPAPSIPQSDVFAELRERHAEGAGE